MNKEYHIGAGNFGIYAGILKTPNEWKEKSECTNEAIEAVRDYMVDNCLTNIEQEDTGGYTWKLKNGNIVELRISILKNKKEV